jgi:hypothetical protein
LNCHMALQSGSEISAGTLPGTKIAALSFLGNFLIIA